MEIALTAIYGIGRSRAHSILDAANIPYGKKPPELTTDEGERVRKECEGHKIEGDLRREIGSSIKRLKEIGSYRGERHTRSLPVRGQRTKTNSRTRHGNVRKTMGSGKKKLDKK